MNLADVMDEVGDRLDTLAGLNVYRYPADNVQPPAAVVTYPDTYTYDETYGRGMDRMTLPVVLLIGKVSDRASRDRLSDWLDRSGTHRYGIDRTDQLTKHTMSVDGTKASGVAINGANLQFTLTTGVSQGISNLRDIYTRNDIVGADFHAQATFDPPFFGDPDAGGPLNPITPQHGLALRYQADTKQRAVIVWNNIVFGFPALLVGVWQANLDGTGFGNRQYPVFFPAVGPVPGIPGLPLPYTVEVRLVGKVVKARYWQVGRPVPTWNDPNQAVTVNLDTDAGDAVAIPTPVGVGAAGLVAAHLGSDTSPPSMARYPLDDVFFELDSHAIKETLEANVDTYTAFGSLRVMDADFDIIAIAGVDYLAATLHIDIAGLGA